FGGRFIETRREGYARRREGEPCRRFGGRRAHCSDGSRRRSGFGQRSWIDPPEKGNHQRGGAEASQGRREAAAGRGGITRRRVEGEAAEVAGDDHAVR